MMNFEARNQYMQTLRERYLKSDKKGKGRILDEYCKNTGQDRKYAIKKFRYKAGLKPAGSARKARKQYYNGLPVEASRVSKKVSKKVNHTYAYGVKLYHSTDAVLVS